MKILIAIDDLKFAEDINSYLCAHKWKPGTEFMVLHVVEPFIAGTYVTVMPPALVEEIMKEMWSQGESLVRKVALKLRDHFHSPRIFELVLQGQPASTILNCARDFDADLVVMGTHKRHGMQRFLLGSVSGDVAARAHCSVLVVYPAATEASPEAGELVTNATA